MTVKRMNEGGYASIGAVHEPIASNSINLQVERAWPRKWTKSLAHWLTDIHTLSTFM